jgi:hypothetical protein
MYRYPFQFRTTSIAENKRIEDVRDACEHVGGYKTGNIKYIHDSPVAECCSQRPMRKG